MASEPDSSGRVRVRVGGLLQDWLPRVVDSEFWGKSFSDADVRDYLSKAQTGFIEHVGSILARHLPREGVILDAGCGFGRVVAGLLARGFNCVGIDYSAQCIRMARKAMPDLPVEIGDIYHLEWPDGGLAGYVSYGVIEHNRSGPQQALREAFRVLRPGGVIIVSVPTVNVLRRLRELLGAYPVGPPADGFSFYQYIFSPRQLREYLRGAGFDIVREYTIDAPTGLSQDVRLIERMRRRQPRLWKLVLGPWHVVGFLRALVGHSLVCVAVRPRLP